MVDLNATWWVRTPDGDLLRPLSTIQLLQGIEEGWLTVHDEVHVPTGIGGIVSTTSTVCEKIESAFRDVPPIALRTNPQRYYSVLLVVPFGLVAWLLYFGAAAGARSVAVLVATSVAAGLIFGYQTRRAYYVGGSAAALGALALCPVGLLLLPVGVAVAAHLAPGGRPQDIAMLIAFRGPILAYALVLSSKGIAWNVAWRTAGWLFLAPFLGIVVLGAGSDTPAASPNWKDFTSFAAGASVGAT
jgi:hypothetical protein